VAGAVFRSGSRKNSLLTRTASRNSVLPMAARIRPTSLRWTSLIGSSRMVMHADALGD
jgi:hypothetical protein